MADRSPSPSGRRAGPGRLPALCLAGAAVLLVVFAYLALRYAGLPPDQHVPVTGGTVTLSGAERYEIYLESGTDSPAAELTGITGPDGATPAVTPASGRTTYSAGGRHGVLIGSFTAPAPGPYRLTGATLGDAGSEELVVGTRTVGRLLAVIFTGTGAGMLLLFGGLMLVAARRSRPRPPPSDPGYTVH